MSTTWSQLEWANMTADQVAATIAAMEREHLGAGTSGRGAAG